MRYRLVDGRLEAVSTTSSPTRRRLGRLERYVCAAASAPACSFRTWSYAAAERHADEHGGGRIAVDLELVEAAYLEAAS